MSDTKVVTHSTCTISNDRADSCQTWFQNRDHALSLQGARFEARVKNQDRLVNVVLGANASNCFWIRVDRDFQIKRSRLVSGVTQKTEILRHSLNDCAGVRTQGQQAEPERFVLRDQFRPRQYAGRFSMSFASLNDTF